MTQRRRVGMRLCAHGRAGDLAGLDGFAEAQGASLVRGPELGLVMVRGRVGGGGGPFNLGEATVARANVRLRSGEMGAGYVLGRDKEKARLAALCDALLQHPAAGARVVAEVLDPIAPRRDAERAKTAAQVAATKVDFFTVERGED